MYFKVFDKNGNDITKDEFWMVTSEGEIISIDDVYAILYFNDGRSRTVFDEKEKRCTICAKHFYKEAIKEFVERLKEKIGDCHIVSDDEYCGFDCGDIHECIDNLLKEMVGEE